MNINWLESAKYGVIMGVGLCLYTLLMWLTNLDSTYLHIGQYFDMAIILLPLSIISIGINKQNSLANITLLQRIVIAILIGAVSFLIYNPFLYFYHNVVNPEWFTAVLSLKELELTAANISPEVITEQLETMKNSSIANAGMFQVSSIIASVIVIPVLISFITLLFIKHKKSS